MRKLTEGTLDNRPPIRIGVEYIQFLRNKYKRMSKLIEIGEYKPVKVAVASGRYFIADGKHTAALCVVKKVPIKCIDVSPLLHDSFNWWCYRKMLKNKAHYKKHIEFYESIMPDIDRNSVFS